MLRCVRMEIKETIQKALSELGYDPLLPVQQAVIPRIRGNENLFVQAKTGSGKTAAFLIPLLERIDPADMHTSVLVLSPTRELAVQTGLEAVRISSYTRIHVVTCIGGMDIDKQKNALKHRPHMIIGTPGRLKDLLDQGSIDLSALTAAVLDEADMLYSTGQLTEVRYLMERIPENTQRICLSATLTESVRSFLRPDTAVLKLDEAEVSDRVETYFIKTEDKKNTLLAVLTHLPVQRAAVFVNHRSDAIELSDLLSRNYILSSAFSGYFSEDKRLAILQNFRKGRIRVLIATDAAARGLDIPSVTHVIHYDLPCDRETWIHRSGRSGHRQEAGIAIAFLNEEESRTDTGMYIQRSSQPLTYSEKSQYDLSEPLEEEAEKKTGTLKVILKAGRMDKIRVKDVVGALCTVLPFESIGTVEIQDRYSSAVLFTDDPGIISKLNTVPVKGRKRIFELARD